MIKIAGYFRDYEERVILVVPLDKKEFDRFLIHVRDNMFFAYRRVDAKFRVVLLNSIGDHLDRNNIQNLIKAEICVELTIKEEITKDTIKKLEAGPFWYIFLSCGEESLIFSIDKETQFINSRSYYKEK